MKIEKKALTFDDVLLLPGYSEVLPKETNLKATLTAKLSINLPIVSAAMDTVTESKLAIALAEEGGVGIIHKNLSPELQAIEVMKVKRFEAGVVKEPITISPGMSVREVMRVKSVEQISGLPVIDNEKKVVGIVTNRDLRFETELDQPVSNIMTPKKLLVTVNEGVSIDIAKALMHKHRIERVLVVDKEFYLKGLITVKDILKGIEHPLAARDDQGKLLVGAAVGVAGDTEERVERLISAGVDLIVVDTAHGHSKGVIDRIKWIKSKYSNIQIIGGNIATGDAAKALADVGVDGVKVGIGPGSICTTRIVAGVGVPQITAINEVSNALKSFSIPVVADGGIRYSGDIGKALAAGANSVMIGSMFAGADEAPGEIIFYQGRSFKSYRGMGSVGAMQDGSADRYFQEGENPASEKFVPEGIEGRVPCKGSIKQILYQLAGGIKACLGYTGSNSIADLHSKAKFVEASSAGMRESHVHDVQITKEAPNYQID
ncbi:MAG: IMP dehydrogenase [Burkholderiaceae bacterium]|nr:IMP dehydrogenase [Rickettsiales bacterium]